jgi:peptidyl-prolyl cis-trans isomerase SurA
VLGSLRVVPSVVSKFVIKMHASPQIQPGQAQLARSSPFFAAVVVAGLLLGIAPLPSSNVMAQATVSVDRVVAVVNSDAITYRELSLRAANVERQIRRQNAEMPPRDVLFRQVLEQIVVDKAVMQLAKEQGIRIDEAQLDRATEQFARENRVSVADLRSRLEREGGTFSSFREELRSEIIRGRLREREVDARIQISEGDIDAYLAARGADTTTDTELHLAQILLPLSGDASAADVERQRLRGEELIKQINRGIDFARLASSFSTGPEALSGGSLGYRTADRLPQVFVEQVEKLNVGAISGLVRSGAGFHILKVLDKRNASAKGGDLGVVKQTRARHILIRTSELVSEAEAIRRLADSKLRAENKSATFEDLARQFSNDGSASRGGDLGWVYPGDTVPDFERSMDALQIDQISEPFKSPFGYHIIQVLERKNEVPSADRQRSIARQAIRERRMEEAYDSWIRQVRDSAYVEYRVEEQ